jgi:uncharacterized protein YbjT (DUF2867 family)
MFPDQFRLRGITRSLNSEEGKKCKQSGIEMVEASYDNLPSLQKAFKGAYGAYLVPEESESAEKIMKNARNLADMCKENGIKHVVWSTMEDTRPVLKDQAPLLEGKWTVPRFDARFESNNFFKDLPHTFLYTSLPYETFCDTLAPRRVKEGDYSISTSLGKAQLPMIAIDDIGIAAATIFSDNKWIGKDVYVAGDILTMDKISKNLSKALDVKVAPVELDDEAFRKEIKCDEMANMFRFFRLGEKEFIARRNLSNVKQVIPKVRNFETWVEENKQQFKLAQKD